MALIRRPKIHIFVSCFEVINKYQANTYQASKYQADKQQKKAILVLLSIICSFTVVSLQRATLSVVLIANYKYINAHSWEQIFVGVTNLQ